MSIKSFLKNLENQLWHIFQYFFGAIELKSNQVISNYNNEKKILEIGCGTGFLSEVFQTDIKYTGLDLNLARIKIAKKKYPEHKFFATYKDLDNNKYDFIILSAIIHHLSDNDFRKLIKLISNYSTKDTGIHIMEPIQPKRNLIKILFLFFFEKGLYVRSEDDYKQLLVSNNLQIITSKACTFKLAKISLVDHYSVFSRFN